MNVMMLQILLFFIFPATIHSNHPCPNSTCGNSYFTINYPFKLQTDHQPKDCPDLIDLRCDEQGHVVVNLPSAGDFYVTFINYVLQRIYLTDPGNCLLGRLMVTNISVYPLQAYFSENYTYYVCPKERIAPPFSEIKCLSNSTNATIATTVLSSEYMEDKYGCQMIASSQIPVSWSSQYNLSGNFGDLQLTWNVSSCTECEEYVLQVSGDSKSNLAKFFGSPLFIPSAVVLLTFLGIASLLRIMKLIGGRTTTTATATDLSIATRATGDTAENSQVKSFSEVAALSESEGTLVSCSICLEEYNGEDIVRNMSQCGHYFHANCIDQWLHNNTTCPVCRTSFS